MNHLRASLKVNQLQNMFERKKERELERRKEFMIGVKIFIRRRGKSGGAEKNSLTRATPGDDDV